MKKKTTLLLFLLILSIYTFNINVQISAEENDYRLSSLELTPHDPIEIRSDSDFEVFPGTGTAEDPYIIDGYNITTTSSIGIEISGTTKYFVIKNCYVNALDYGILINNIADGTAIIRNNNCSYNYYGIYLYDSSNNTLSGNNCSSNNYYGIYLYDSWFSTVANNTCNNNYYDGIRLSSSGNSTVANNTFTNCGLYILEDTLVAYLSYTVENNWVNGKRVGYFTNLDSTIIAEPVYGQLILVNCTNVTVRDQIINNTSLALVLQFCTYSVIINNTCNNNFFGIYLRYSGSSTVANNTCTNNNWDGISLYSSGSSIVANNTCNDNGYGIYLYSSGSSTVTNNTCNNNGYGIYLSSSGNSTIANNTFTNCGLDIREDTLDAYLSYTVENNWVNSKKLGFYTNLDSTIIAEPVYSQLILVNCTNVTVRDQILNNATTGLFLYFCTYSTITNNTCSNNGYGIRLYSSGSSTVVNNTCSNNYYGIRLYYSGSSTVVNNTCSYNSNYGILLSSSGNSTLANNMCNNNRYGINLYYSDNSAVANNTCSNNYWDGIRLEYSSSSTVVNNTCSYNSNYGINLYYSDNSAVANNTCSNNYWDGIRLYSSGSSTVVNNTCSYNSNYGIRLSSSGSSTVVNNTCSNNYYGLSLYSSAFCVVTYNLLQENEKHGIWVFSSSDNNLIYHNTFVDNNLGGTSQAYDSGANNYWYDTATLEGNYWSDWSGIGSYSIDGEVGAIDFYPLDEPTVYPSPPVITNVVHYPSSPTELDTVTINAIVTDASGVQSVTLYYRVNGGAWQTISMTLVSSDIYSVTIGPFAVSDTIEYYITAVDNSINHNEATVDNSGLYYSFTVTEIIPEFQIFSLLLPAITLLFLGLGLMVLQRRKK